MLATHNIDIQAMLVWLTLPFYDFCGFRSVAVNSVYKLQFFYIYCSNNSNSQVLVEISRFNLLHLYLATSLRRNLAKIFSVRKLLAVLVVGRTDGHTDNGLIHGHSIERDSIASHGKKVRIDYNTVANGIRKHNERKPIM